MPVHSCTMGLARGNLLEVSLDSRWPAAAAAAVGWVGGPWLLPPHSSSSWPAQTDLSPATTGVSQHQQTQLVFVNTFTQGEAVCVGRGGGGGRWRVGLAACSIC
jgi:hypothetical protein